MPVTRAWKVYGADGHRQRESFHPSESYNWSDENRTRILEVINSDKTGTNQFTIIRITRDSAKECESDGKCYSLISDRCFGRGGENPVLLIDGERVKLAKIRELPW